MTTNSKISDYTIKDNKKDAAMCYGLTPPWTHLVKTFVGRIFLKLIDKNSSVLENLTKICNRNNIKLIYSCVKKMLKKQYPIIKINYWIIVTITKIATRKIENANVKKNPPLSDQCLISNIVYRGSIKCDHREQYYFGSTEAEWKQRFYNHKPE